MLIHRRSARSLALVVSLLCCAGCGGEDDEPSSPPTASPNTAYVTLAEARILIEARELAVVRTGRPSAKVSDGPPLSDSARLQTQSGRAFDLLVFRSPRDAEAALTGVIELEGNDSGVRAANVVATFPQRFSAVPAYAEVATQMRRLRDACRPAATGPADLRRLCFGDAGGPTVADGTDRDEAATEERPVTVGAFRYDVQFARRLNSEILPDRDILSRGARPGRQLLGVVVRVCNVSREAATPSDELRLVDALGARRSASTAVPADSPFAYRPTVVDPGECLPATGSVADAVNDGGLIAFELDDGVLRNRPLSLEVTGADGERARIILDL